MNFDELSDAELDQLRTMSKVVTNARIQWKEKPGHRQKNYLLENDRHQFELYLRQSKHDESDFSCGLSVIKPDGLPLTLCRYNGGAHIHGAISYQCHIHKATNAAIVRGLKPESHADETDRYCTLDGALYCLVKDCSISGLRDLRPDQPDMFSK